MSIGCGGVIRDLVTEDQDLGVRLLLAGHPVRWLHGLRIADEKPASLGVAIRQRAHWTSGKTTVRRTLLGSLLRKRSPVAWDPALRVTQSSRTFLAMVSGMLTVVAAIWPSRYLWRYPAVTIFGLIYLPVRLLGRLTRGWYHTPHRGHSYRPALNLVLLVPTGTSCETVPDRPSFEVV